MTDSSPVTADKKWASVHLVKVHKLRNAQSTHPVVNHAQDLYQLVFLARENKTLLFWLSLPGKNPVMKIDHLYIFIFFSTLSFFVFSYIHWTLATKAEYVVKFDLQKKGTNKS